MRPGCKSFVIADNYFCRQEQLTAITPQQVKADALAKKASSGQEK
jgi:hypothetical protein